MGGAASVDLLLEALRILQPPGGNSASLNSGLEIGLGFLEAGPGLRREMRIFEGVVETRRIGGRAARRWRKIFAIRLTARKAGIKSGAAFGLWAGLAIVPSGLALGHLELARRTMLYIGRASGLPRCLRHCELDARIAGTRRNRRRKEYGANARMGEQAQSCFHDSPLVRDATRDCRAVTRRFFKQESCVGRAVLQDQTVPARGTAPRQARGERSGASPACGDTDMAVL
jgi:hypothetical protein